MLYSKYFASFIRRVYSGYTCIIDRFHDIPETTQLPPYSVTDNRIKVY